MPLKQQGSVASYTSATFQLNQTMIRNFYDLGNRLVYYVDGKSSPLPALAPVYANPKLAFNPFLYTVYSSS